MRSESDTHQRENYQRQVALKDPVTILKYNYQEFCINRSKNSLFVEGFGVSDPMLMHLLNGIWFDPEVLNMLAQLVEREDCIILLACVFRRSVLLYLVKYGYDSQVYFLQVTQ